MASGDFLWGWEARHNNPPASSIATPAWILATGDTPQHPIPVLEFDPSTQEYAIFNGWMPDHYGGGGVTVEILWTSQLGAAANVKLDVAFKRINDGGTALASTTFAAVNTTTVAHNGTAGSPNADTITFTDGADMASVAAGEFFSLLFTRDSADAADTMNSNDLQLIGIRIYET